jgi:hypothetical protein
MTTRPVTDHKRRGAGEPSIETAHTGGKHLSEQSILSAPVSALLMDISDDWQASRTYLTLSK